VGALWENFLVSERRKMLSYNNFWRNSWFWRTSDQKEIDYIEEGDGQLSAYEFKWNPQAKTKVPGQFTKGYPDSTFTVVHPDNVDGFLL
jgi:predicted AAA+ superfamily ATPase